MGGRSKLIKVSEEEYELIQKAQKMLQRKGFESAGISEDEESKLNWEDFALGAIAGIGAYLLYKSLTKK